MDFPKPSKLTTAFSDQSINRPQFHFTPDFGWMNDPNGLWKDSENELYHLYYQYNPADTVWALPLYWGHATSKDLITWTHVTEYPLPIGPIAIEGNEYKEQVDPESGAYSGSIFIDDENQSGWFEKSSNLNVIAAWTYNYPNCEKQWLSYSKDNGTTFYNPYKQDGTPANPMVSDGEDTLHFRDPQVIKLKDIKDDKHVYIMTVAKPQEYKIFFMLLLK
jgi:beta-fructofuranosidase